MLHRLIISCRARRAIAVKMRIGSAASVGQIVTLLSAYLSRTRASTVPAQTVNSGCAPKRGCSRHRRRRRHRRCPHHLQPCLRACHLCHQTLSRGTGVTQSLQITSQAASRADAARTRSATAASTSATRRGLRACHLRPIHQQAKSAASTTTSGSAHPAGCRNHLRRRRRHHRHHHSTRAVLTAPVLRHTTQAVSRATAALIRTDTPASNAPTSISRSACRSRTCFRPMARA